MIRNLIAVSILSVSVQAGAVGVAVTVPVKSAIEVKPAELILKKEKAYNCTLEGVVEGGWVLNDTLDLKITATSLEDAAELALTPYVIAAPARENDPVKIKVDGQNFIVRKVNCQAITKSI